MLDLRRARASTMPLSSPVVVSQAHGDIEVEEHVVVASLRGEKEGLTRRRSTGQEVATRVWDRRERLRCCGR